MSFARLGLWLLRRERASGEWRVLLLALIIGVGSVSTTGFLGDRLKRAMSEQGASFLGADLLVTSPRPIEDWPDLVVTKSAGTASPLARSQALEFPSMLAKGDAFQLATLRAVDASYPLRGSVRIADRPFAAGTARPAQPPPGMIYVAPDLLPCCRPKWAIACRSAKPASPSPESWPRNRASSAACSASRRASSCAPMKSRKPACCSPAVA